MKNGFSKIREHSKFAVLIGCIVAAMLLVLEIILTAQYILRKPPVWGIILIIFCEVVVDALCFGEFFVTNIKVRIGIYVADFLMLLIVSILSASPYIASLYCVILTQFYLSVKDFKTKLSVFIASCVMFVITCLVGWVINNNQSVNFEAILSVVSDNIWNIIILITHFAVANFLIEYYDKNKQLTKALKESDENKKMLEEAYKQLSETAVYEERNRIARDIHDNAGHSMTAVIMQTEAAKLIIDSNPEEAKNKIISANMQAKNALEQMRESVHLLAGRDASITLKAEVEEVIVQTMDGTDIVIRYDLEDISLPYIKRRFIINSLKECLTNGMRHGHATAFYIELAVHEENVTLTVSDNGTGLPRDFKEGFGLRGLREKATGFGGNIVIESEENEGAEISISIPLHDKEEK